MRFGFGFTHGVEGDPAGIVHHRANCGAIGAAQK
jgi:hypothetical protein